MPINDGYTHVFDPANNVTHTYDAKGNYLGAENGDISRPADPNNLQDYTRRVSGGGTQTDWSKYIKDNISDMIPAAITATMPEFKGMGVIGNLLSRLGISTGVGSIADMALNANNDKTKMHSLVDAGTNSVLGNLVPDLMNVGISPRGITRTSTTVKEPTTTSRSSETTRSNSGKQQTSSNYTSTTGPEIPPYIPGVGPNGQVLFGKKPQPTGNTISEGSTNSTTGSAGTGVSNTESTGVTIPGLSTTNREIGLPGVLGHALEVMRSLQAYNAQRVSPLTRILTGIGLNLSRDAADRPQQ